MITKDEYKKALEEKRILIHGCKYTRNGYTEFSVYEIKDNKLFDIDVPTASYHAKNCFNLYKCSAWGTSRTLEIILAIGYELGLRFDEIKQNYITLAGR